MAIAHVQTPAGGVSNSSATSVALAFGANVTSGSAILGGWRYGTNGRTVTLSDDQSNTYTSDTISASDPNDGNSTVGIGFALNCAGAATTVTFAISGAAANLRFSTSEFSGMATSSARDQAAGASGTSATPDPGSLTPTTDGQLFFVAAHSAGGETYTAGTDFTLNTTVPTTGGSQRLATQRFIQTTAAAHATSLTKTQSSASWSAVAATFKEAGGGGGGGATAPRLNRLSTLGVH